MGDNLLMKKAEDFLESRKYSNNLVDIIQSLDDESLMTEAINAVQLIFSEILAKRTMLIHETNHEDKIISDYVSWLRNCYEQCWDKLTNIVSIHGNKQSVSTLFTFITAEGKFPRVLPEKGKYYVPDEKVEKFIRCIVFGSSVKPLLKTISICSNYIDFVYYSWLKMPSILVDIKSDENAIINALCLIEELTIPSAEELNTSDTEVLVWYTKSKPKFRPIYSELQCKVTECWTIMTKWDHSKSTYTQLLNILVEHMLSHLQKPTLTMDFLMNALNFGGSIALAALQGVFTLVTEFNLEHPDIFGKLYTLLEPEILNTEHKSRLFYFVDIFMRSTHLPETLVASYVKRMARLCLNATPENIMIMITLIRNLIIRHPGLSILIARSNEEQVTSDPFLDEECDPMNTNALNSSLWEIQSLEDHILPQVSRIASFINRPLPRVETDLNTVLKKSDEIFKATDKKKIHNISVTFEKPTTLCMPRTDYFSQLWSLTA